MDWDELFTMQRQLDKYIEENHDLSNTNLFEHKYLALLVELGELANETRCFKFWSNKPRNESNIILEEYVDGIHFILSLGLEKGYRFKSKKLDETTKTETEQFNEVFDACTTFKKSASKENYESLFSTYLQLGQLLGFSELDIQNAYYKKNEINYERQDKGY
ncbi:dUTP diphosphatase [Oceanobacillus halophilus]|uniref:dUTPase n=1 Tax=Oceanobacillus halophilus TaxID=930130 RepID=A0A494ZVD1_9BACI|nr:dUTP diphosphatase [Oceanobacillus halophilus]RKQ29928.1 dUTPase [Oceanobacillus halophilus]